MRKKSRPGFTMLEFLISFAIVTILLLGAAQITLHALYVKKTSDCRLEAAELASAKLECLKSLPYDSPALGESINVESIESIKRNDIYRLEWRIFDISENLKKIEMECFSIINAQKKTQLILLYSKELGF